MTLLAFVRLWSRRGLAVGLGMGLALALGGSDRSAVLSLAGYLAAAGDLESESPGVDTLDVGASVPTATRPGGWTSVVHLANAPDPRLGSLRPDRGRAPPLPA
jgi:hypothetical protein